MKKIKVYLEAEQPESGLYADENEDRLKENIFHLFNGWQVHLLWKVQKQMILLQHTR